MFKFQKKKCTAETNGTLTYKRWNGEVWFIGVEYTVSGKTYYRKEQLTYNIVQKYQAGGLPVGYHAASSAGSLEIGTKMRVRYNPDKPKQSYLPDNQGKHLK